MIKLELWQVILLWPVLPFILGFIISCYLESRRPENRRKK